MVEPGDIAGAARLAEIGFTVIVGAVEEQGQMQRPVTGLRIGRFALLVGLLARAGLGATLVTFPFVEVGQDRRIGFREPCLGKSWGYFS
ncbi:hypothetical protein [Pseudomonas sp. Marseille-Q8238]